MELSSLGFWGITIVILIIGIVVGTRLSKEEPVSKSKINEDDGSKETKYIPPKLFSKIVLEDKPISTKEILKASTYKLTPKQAMLLSRYARGIEQRISDVPKTKEKRQKFIKTLARNTLANNTKVLYYMQIDINDIRKVLGKENYKELIINGDQDSIIELFNKSLSISTNMTHALSQRKEITPKLVKAIPPLDFHLLQKDFELGREDSYLVEDHWSDGKIKLMRMIVNKIDIDKYEVEKELEKDAPARGVSWLIFHEDLSDEHKIQIIKKFNMLFDGEHKVKHIAKRLVSKSIKDPYVLFKYIKTLDHIEPKMYHEYISKYHHRVLMHLDPEKDQELIIKLIKSIVVRKLRRKELQDVNKLDVKKQENIDKLYNIFKHYYPPCIILLPYNTKWNEEITNYPVLCWLWNKHLTINEKLLKSLVDYVEEGQDNLDDIQASLLNQGIEAIYNRIKSLKEETEEEIERKRKLTSLIQPINRSTSNVRITGHRNEITIKADE